MFSSVKHFYKSTTCINSINLHNILGSYYYHHHFSDDDIGTQKIKQNKNCKILLKNTSHSAGRSGFEVQTV